MTDDTQNDTPRKPVRRGRTGSTKFLPRRSPLADLTPEEQESYTVRALKRDLAAISIRYGHLPGFATHLRAELPDVFGPSTSTPET